MRSSTLSSTSRPPSGSASRPSARTTISSSAHPGWTVPPLWPPSCPAPVRRGYDDHGEPGRPRTGGPRQGPHRPGRPVGCGWSPACRRGRPRPTTTAGVPFAERWPCSTRRCGRCGRCWPASACRGLLRDRPAARSPAGPPGGPTPLGGELGFAGGYAEVRPAGRRLARVRLQHRTRGVRRPLDPAPRAGRDTGRGPRRSATGWPRWSPPRPAPGRRRAHRAARPGGPPSRRPTPAATGLRDRRGPAGQGGGLPEAGCSGCWCGRSAARPPTTSSSYAGSTTR